MSPPWRGVPGHTSDTRVPTLQDLGPSHPLPALSPNPGPCALGPTYWCSSPEAARRCQVSWGQGWGDDDNNKGDKDGGAWRPLCPQLTPLRSPPGPAALPGARLGVEVEGAQGAPLPRVSQSQPPNKAWILPCLSVLNFSGCFGVQWGPVTGGGGGVG